MLTIYIEETFFADKYFGRYSRKALKLIKLSKKSQWIKNSWRKCFVMTRYLWLQSGAMALDGPTAEQLKRMREELQEDPEVFKEDLARLRDWLSKQPHLPHHMGKSV